MSTFESARFVRFATVLAVALILMSSGVVVGAAGGPLIMGAANTAGTTNTSLTTSSTGTAFLVTQTSTGTALRGTATNGIAGFFTSANGSGISGVVSNNTKYGVFGANDAGSFGGGAAIRASGQQNNGVVATTANASADALRGINTGGGQALDLVVNAEVPPMSVNSDGLVTNLNADQLDGLDSTQLINGTGDSGGGAFNADPGIQSPLIQGPGFIVDYVCPPTVTDPGALRLVNKTGSTVHLFVDGGGTNPGYTTVANDVLVTIPTPAAGDFQMIQFNAEGGARVGTIWAFTVHLVTQCHVQAQWMETTS